MILFQDDYIISWDVSDKDYPCISISRLRGEAGKLVCDVLGQSYATSGVVSVRQLLGEFYPCKPDIFEKTYERVEEDA